MSSSAETASVSAGVRAASKRCRAESLPGMPPMSTRAFWPCTYGPTCVRGASQPFRMPAMLCAGYRHGATNSLGVMVESIGAC